MSSQRNKDVVRRFDELTSGGGDLSQLDELATLDLVNHTLAPGRPSGLEGTREFLSSARRGPRASLGSIGRSCRGRPRGAVRRSRGRVASAIVPRLQHAERELHGRAAFMYRLVDGKIAERWAVRDDLGMMLQLGVLTPPQ